MKFHTCVGTLLSVPVIGCRPPSGNILFQGAQISKDLSKKQKQRSPSNTTRIFKKENQIYNLCAAVRACRSVPVLSFVVFQE